MSRHLVLLARTHLLESEDEADLRAACERFAARGELIELRRLAE